MLETMYAAPGIGLAAIQVGIPKKIIVLDIAPKDQPRNPMYFAMLLVLLSITIKFNIIGGATMSLAFVFFITTFQIIPEEIAMKKLFGAEFDRYKKRTRRWI